VRGHDGDLADQEEDIGDQEHGREREHFHETLVNKLHRNTFIIIIRNEELTECQRKYN
jgi:hypothetical protein